MTVSIRNGHTHRGIALIGADGVKSAVRSQCVGDEARVSGDVVYRAVVDQKDFPGDLTNERACSRSRRIATSSTIPCAMATNTTSSSRSTAARRRSGACAKAAARKCRATRGSVRAAPADRPAEGAGSAGPPPTASRSRMDLRPRHAARRCRAPDAAVPGAGRLHGAGGRGHARRRVARRRTTSAGVRALPGVAPHARHESCSRPAKWAASSTRRVSSGWCATSCGRTAPGTLLDAIEWLLRMNPRQVPGGVAGSERELTRRAEADALQANQLFARLRNFMGWSTFPRRLSRRPRGNPKLVVHMVKKTTRDTGLAFGPTRSGACQPAASSLASPPRSL